METDPGGELNNNEQNAISFKIKSDEERKAEESFEERKKFHRSENVLKFNNLNHDINRYNNSFDFELNMKKPEEIGEYEKYLADKLKKKDIDFDNEVIIHEAEKYYQKNRNENYV